MYPVDYGYFESSTAGGAEVWQKVCLLSRVAKLQVGDGYVASVARLGHSDLYLPGGHNGLQETTTGTSLTLLEIHGRVLGIHSFSS